MRLAAALLSCVGIFVGLIDRPVSAASWPQFRGINGSGRAAAGKLPADIGPDKNVVWKVQLPPGHSSPAVVGNRIYVTAVDGEKLLTIGLARDTGKVVWRQEAPHQKFEAIHRIGSYAQPSPAADGERVVSFFGSSGLNCYDTSGKLLWWRPMGPFNNDFGAGSSPLIVDDYVILCQDHDTDSFLTAIDKRSGETVWTTDRSEFPRNYCTPVIANVDGKKQIVVAATLRVVGYDLKTGKEQWTVRGIARAACSSPAIDDAGNIYIASWAGGGEPGSRIQVDPFDQVAAKFDANKNGTLERSELPDGGPIHRRYSQVDRDKTGSVTKQEYEYFRGLFDKSRNVLVAIKPGGTGDITKSHVNWEFTKYIPFCASPVYDNGLVFTVKDGGILTSLNAKSGAPIQTKRLPGTGNFYASPVAGDGKIYLLNERGHLTVVSAEGDWQVLATSEFGDDTYATPAIVDGRIYLRTAKHLYCFGSSASE